MNWLSTNPFAPTLLVGVGGAIGSVARYTSGLVLNHWFQTGSHIFATSLVNVLGSFILGCLAASFSDRTNTLYILLGVGFCGGFTTFSTFSLEMLEHLQKGNVLACVLLCTANVFLGLFAIYLGYEVCKFK